MQSSSILLDLATEGQRFVPWTVFIQGKRTGLYPGLAASRLRIHRRMKSIAYPNVRYGGKDNIATLHMYGKNSGFDSLYLNT